MKARMRRPYSASPRLCRGCLTLPGMLVLLSVVLVPASSTSAAGARDFAVGGGLSFINSSFGFSAHCEVADCSGPTGGPATGHFSETCENSAGCTFPEFKNRVEVTCLNVLGNKATIGGVFTEAADNQFPAGTGFVIVVREGRAEVGGAQTISLVPPGLNCPPPAIEPAAITHGRITVNDGAR